MAVAPKLDMTGMVGIECRSVTFIPPIKGNDDDYHMVKEIVHFDDGRAEPNIRILKNYTRSYWTTKEYHRKSHTQKKEWEDINKLSEHKTTQSQLVANAARSLNMFGFNGGLRKLARSPYLYGCDILSTSVVKQELYRNKWPTLNTPSSIATSDTETCMDTKKVIMQTISYKNKVFTAVVRSFLKNIEGTEAQKIEQCKKAFNQYLSNVDQEKKKDGKKVIEQINVIEKRNLEWELILVDNDGAAVYACLQKAHEWKPDFLTFWNMDFDVKRMNEALSGNGYNLADAWSDPSIAPAYRFFEYRESNAQKVTASGKKSPIAFHARWNVLTAPASFYVIDSMCAYKQIRTGKPEERSYGLDAIMFKHTKMHKLKTNLGNNLTRAEWHIYMQRNHPIEYIIYNTFDCVGFDMLCEQTKDLSVSLPSGAAMSDYGKFNSQPRRVVDKLHYFCLDRKLVAGTTSDQMETEFDALTISLKKWIVMLPAHLVDDNGLKCIKEYPELSTNIRLFVADLDVSASYPSGEVVYNISKETTKKELLTIEGKSESIRRAQGINLSGGCSNAVEFCTSLFDMPQHMQWLEAYTRQHELDKVVEEYKEHVDDLVSAANTLDHISEELDEDEAEVGTY